MKNILLAFLMCIGLIGCDENYKQINTNIDGSVDINGKKCEVVIVRRTNGGYLYYIDCPTGSSVTYQSGKNSYTTMATNKSETIQTSEPTSCPVLLPKPCSCQ